MAEKNYYGIYQGIVTKNTDPEKRGRIKCQIPDVLGSETDSAWCDPMIPVAYDGGGDFCLPQKKEAVWIMFIAGDSNRPVWLGGWWSDKSTPIGNTYTNLDDLRIINYADCTITMKNGIININVGEGTCDLEIIHNQVKVRGNLVVTGSLNVGSSISAGGSIHGSNI